MAIDLVRRALSRRPGTKTPEAYTRVQVALHWLVVALVIAQYATSGAIVRTHSAHLIGHRQSPTDLVLHSLHNRVGLALVALMIGRLGYRLWAGTPVPAGRTGLAIRAAGLVHAAFYVVLIAKGSTGAIASYLWWPISAAHVILFKILLGLVAVHLGAVVWHQMVLRDDVLHRIGVRRPVR